MPDDNEGWITAGPGGAKPKSRDELEERKEAKREQEKQAHRDWQAHNERDGFTEKTSRKGKPKDIGEEASQMPDLEGQRRRDAEMAAEQKRKTEELRRVDENRERSQIRHNKTEKEEQERQAKDTKRISELENIHDPSAERRQDVINVLDQVFEDLGAGNQKRVAENLRIQDQGLASEVSNNLRDMWHNFKASFEAGHVNGAFENLEASREALHERLQEHSRKNEITGLKKFGNLLKYGFKKIISRLQSPEKRVEADRNYQAAKEGRDMSYLSASNKMVRKVEQGTKKLQGRHQSRVIQSRNTGKGPSGPGL